MLIDKLTEKDLLARFACFTALDRIGQRRPQAWEQIVGPFSSDKAEIRNGGVFAMRNAYDQSLVSISRTIRQ